MRHQLDTEIPSKYKICSTRPFWSVSTTNGFYRLMAEAGCESSVSMGLHFPREQLTRLTPIFARLLSPLLRFRGCHHVAPPRARNLAKTIARDKPVSTLNVLTNIMNTGIIWQWCAKNILYSWRQSQQYKYNSDACKHVIYEYVIS